MKGDRLYLTHILDAVERIETYISVGHDVFVSTSHWQDAVIRQLEIIGEATKRLSKQLCSQHPEVPWRRIAGLRDCPITSCSEACEDRARLPRKKDSWHKGEKKNQGSVEIGRGCRGCL